MDELRDALLAKIMTLNDKIWERRVAKPQIDRWLNNFTGKIEATDRERVLALYLLSHFMYFGYRQMRELIRALYRDLYKYPIVQQIRETNADTTDRTFIQSEFENTLAQTLFLGVGNPSESGCHLLYYFRQENRLSKKRFIHTHEIFRRTGSTGDRSLRDPRVRRYVYIDDFCGSGHQGKQYSDEVVTELKSIAPDVTVSYYVLFATSWGMKHIRESTEFDHVDCLVELDDTFRCFHRDSRYFLPCPKELSRESAEGLCKKYGTALLPAAPLGYDNSQLLIGFHHNTPDNTLPIFWYDEPEGPDWQAIFRRYPKQL